MKYVFIDKNTWGYFDDELKLIGNFDSELGNIYVAKVKKYEKSLDAFFIEYEKNKIGFLNNTKYTENVKASDEILVQMVKESIGDKYPKFSTKISISTENLKYSNDDKLIFEGKQKYKDIEDFKSKYKFTGIVEDDFFKQSKESQSREVEFIMSKLQYIEREKKFLPIPKLLYRQNPVDKIIKRENPDYLITNDKTIYRQYKDIINVKFEENYDYNYDDLISSDIIDKSSNTIKLDNDSEIVIEKTEAMWVVDVNSKHMKKSDDFFEVNKMALKKIHQMIYLKKMVGMIIVDCIRDENKDKLSKFIESEFVEDNINFQGFSNLNLLEFTVRLDNL